jgi:hypothetical protein
MNPLHHRARRSLMALIVVLTALMSFGNQCAQAAGSDPLNVPLDSLGVTGYDTTLCSDRWNTCSDYDRQQFDPWTK